VEGVAAGLIGSFSDIRVSKIANQSFSIQGLTGVVEKNFGPDSFTI